MSVATGNVVVAIKAVDEASSAMDTIRASLSIFGSTISQLGGGFDSLGNVIKGFAGGGVMGGLAAVTGEVVKGLKDCFAVAKESEEAWQRLGAAVERSGADWKDTEAILKEFIESMKKVTRFSEDEMLKAMDHLVTMGMDVDTAMAALGKSMDLAAAKHISLGEAADALGKSYIGMERPLHTMGIEIDKSVPASERFAAAMKEVGEKFGGAAQKDVESYAGKQAQVANAMESLKEKIGTALIPVMNSFQDMMGNVVKGADQLVTQLGEAWKAFTEMPEVKKIADSLSGAFADLQKGFGTVADELGKALLPIFKELWGALQDVWKALSPVIDAFGEIWTALTGVSGEGKEAYTIFNLIADILKATVVPALQGLVEVIKLVTPIIKLFAEGFKTAVEIAIPAIRTIIESVTGFVTTIKETLGGFYKWLVGGSFIQDLMDAAFEAFKAGFASIFEGITGWLGGISNTITAWGKTITDIFTNLWNGIVSFLGGIWKTINDTIAAGAQQTQNTIQNLSNTVAQESIWPDMWNLMIDQTREGLGGILAETGRGLGRIEDTFRCAALTLSPSAGGFPASRGASASESGPTTIHVTIPITIQNMTGELKDLENLTRMISRELGSAVKWRR